MARGVALGGFVLYKGWLCLAIVGFCCVALGSGVLVWAVGLVCWGVLFCSILS